MQASSNAIVGKWAFMLNICKGIVHLGVSCSKSVVKDGDDVHTCIKCYTTPPTVSPLLPPSTSNDTPTPLSPKRKRTASNKCKHCGGTDHNRITNKKGKKYTPRPNKKDKSNNPNTPNNNTITNSSTDNDSTTSSAQRGNNISDSSSASTHEPIRKPNFIKVGDSTATYTPVVDVASPSFKPIPTTFKVKLDDENGQKKEVSATPGNMMNKYLPFHVIEEMVKSSNAYIEKRKRDEPNLSCWKRPKDSALFTISNTYHFLAILYYFGAVKLPNKEAYWSNNPFLAPKLPVVRDLGMTNKRLCGVIFM